jgi:low affinity Fe/Cu permease
MTPHSWYSRCAKATARTTGRPATFLLMVLLVAVWAICGPIFHYSDTWQLTINTGTTIVTFLMVFLIQATQNRDADAIQIKLDEIIRALDTAHNSLLDLEEMEEDELLRVREHYLELAERARAAAKRGQPDTGVPR